MPTIKEVKERLAMIDELDHPLFEELILDGRAGVKAAISKRKRELQKQVDEDLRLEKMLAYETWPISGSSCCNCRDLAESL